MVQRIKEALAFLFAGPLFSILKTLQRIESRLEQMADQADVDRLTEQVSNTNAQLNKGLGEVNNEIAKLREQVEAGQPVDLTGLQQAVDNVAAGTQSLDDIVPDVVPDPEPEPEPVPEPPAEPEQG